MVGLTAVQKVVRLAVGMDESWVVCWVVRTAGYWAGSKEAWMVARSAEYWVASTDTSTVAHSAEC